MKGLRKVLTPFAPDQSGAASVLYDLGGILVICDAGGCAGNICGFDEPRWTTQKSAVFSAGLRDMDAILGRDERLVEKLADAAQKIEAGFAAIIGTPVPAVIATDYEALCRMAQKKTGLPVFAVETKGMDLYDKGEEAAYLALFRALAEEDRHPVEKGRLGVLGLSPMELGDPADGARVAVSLAGEGWRAVSPYGMGASLEEVRRAGACEKNLVLSPAGLAAARALEQRFGTPYEIRFPLSALPLELSDLCRAAAAKRVLIIHQQVLAHSLRLALEEAGAASVTCASWFGMEKSLTRPGDCALREEDDFTALAQSGFDVILADEVLRPLAPGFSGQWVDLPHFAVSGKQVVA